MCSVARLYLALDSSSHHALASSALPAETSLLQGSPPENSLKNDEGMCGTLRAKLQCMLMRDYQRIPGTYVFDGRLAMKGYALNKMCFSFNSAENRLAFLRDEDAYCDKFHLTSEQRAAIKRRDVLALLEAGGNIYYLAKWAGIFGITVQQMGAQQRGISEDEFKKMLASEGGD